MDFHGMTGSELRVLIPTALIFFAVLISVPGILMLARARANQKIRNRLHDVVVDPQHDHITTTIERDVEMSAIPLVNRMLKGANWARRLEVMLVQADVKMKTGSFVMIMLGTGGAVALVVDLLLRRPFAGVVLGVGAATIPLLVVRHKKQQRTLAFEEQFPDALDMLTSALRAGLALTAAIQVVAEEAPDPVGKEFRVLFEENRLGLDMKHAVQMMAERVDSTEARLFATALILQRETGGNLAEVLDGTAAVIRDRFRILRDVRTMTAQARMSGGILMLLPVALAVVVMFLAPEYLKGLVHDPAGKYLIPGALFLQLSGFLMMRRIVDIKV
jgi:tight adherence protein B